MHRPLMLACAALAVAVPARAADLDKMLPEDARFVVRLNVATFLKAEAVKTHVPPFLAREGWGLLSTALGGEDGVKRVLGSNAVALKKILSDKDDVKKLLGAFGDTITSFSVVGQPGTSQPDFMAIEGSWSQGALEGFMIVAVLGNPEIKVKKEGKQNVYEQKQGDETMYMTVPDDGLLLMSFSREKLLDATARHAGKKRPAGAKALRALVRGFDSNHAASVAFHDESAKLKGHGWVKVRRDVRAELTFEHQEEAPAKAMQAEMLADLAKWRKEATAKAKESKVAAIFVTGLKGAKVEQDEGTVKMTVYVPSKDIDALFAPDDDDA